MPLFPQESSKVQHQGFVKEEEHFRSIIGQNYTYFRVCSRSIRKEKQGTPKTPHMQFHHKLEHDKVRNVEACERNIFLFVLLIKQFFDFFPLIESHSFTYHWITKYSKTLWVKITTIILLHLIVSMGQESRYNSDIWLSDSHVVTIRWWLNLEVGDAGAADQEFLSKQSQAIWCIGSHGFHIS